MAIGGALADGERIGVGLQQRPVAERRNVLQQVVSDGRDRGNGDARDLRFARGFSGIATQSGQAAYRLGEQAILLADETHVPIVKRVGQRRREAQADATDEVLRLVAVEHDGVHDAKRIAAGVEVETQRERQPAALAIANVFLRA